MKKPFWSHAGSIALMLVAAAHPRAQRGPAAPQMRSDGPPPAAAPFSITRADPALDAIISPDAKLVELARGFGLTEGGLWIADGTTGYWIVAGLLDNVLSKVTPQNQVSVFMEKAGYTGSDLQHVGTQTRSGRSHVLLIGPSCTGMDRQGRVIWCADNISLYGQWEMMPGGKSMDACPRVHRMLSDLTGSLAGSRTRPVILAGDLNVTTVSECDSDQV